jgi:6-phosphogluconolactonase
VSAPDIQVLDDPAARVAEMLAEAASAGRHIVLTGGSTPRVAYEMAAERDADWSGAEIWFGDERCVPPDDPRSNYRMAREALLDRVPIPPDQIHRIRGEDDPERAAAEYEREVRALLGDAGLDLVLLGMGEDGHTASLFPGQAAVRETARWVVAVYVPSMKMWRVTLTPALLNRSRNVTFVVSGASKAVRLRQVIEGPFTPDLLPAQSIRLVEGRLTWMVDQAAAHALRSPAPLPE